MDEIKHWWNSTKFLTKFTENEINNCRIYYVQHCRSLSKVVDLPKQNFGPSIMCSHCGSLWSKNDHQVRITPGQACSKSVKKIIKSHSENNHLSRFRATLMKKSLKNKMNKIVIKCSICSKNTEINCNKPARLKPIKNKVDEIEVQKSKKKKKKFKDKTAGLNLSNVTTPDATDKKKVIPVNTTPVAIQVKKSKGKEATPLQKFRKLNLSKLSGILNESKDNKTKNNLSNFLKELY